MNWKEGRSPSAPDFTRSFPTISKPEVFKMEEKMELKMNAHARRSRRRRRKRRRISKRGEEKNDAIKNQVQIGFCNALPVRNLCIF